MKEEIDLNEQLVRIQKYEGIPNNPQKKGEKQIWKRFIDWLIPALNRDTTTIGQQVRPIELTGDKRVVEEEKAKRVIDLAASIERKKISNVNISIPKSKAELGEEIIKLKKDIKLLELKYGTKIDISTELKEGLFPEEKGEEKREEEHLEEDQIHDEHILHMRKLLSTLLEDLDLSVRAYNALKAAKIDTLGHLVKFDTHELLKFKYLGKKALVEIEEVLTLKGLTFGMDLSKYEWDED